MALNIDNKGCVIAIFFLTEAGTVMVGELQRRFPDNHLMDATAIVYPQFWLRLDWEELLRRYLRFLKRVLEIQRKCWEKMVL